MTNLILIGVVVSTVITSIVNALKPGYKKVVGRWTVTISTAIAFVLGILAAFSIVPYTGLDVNIGLTIIVGLALGTGSNIFYDLLEVIKAWSDKIKSAIPTKKE